MAGEKITVEALLLALEQSVGSILSAYAKDKIVAQAIIITATSGGNTFEESTMPLIKWMAENVHPHHKAIVDSTGAELLEGRQVMRDTQFIRG